MKKFMILVFSLAVFLVVNAQAKTIFVGIKGGVDMFLATAHTYNPLDFKFNGKIYVPSVEHAGKNPQEVANIHGIDALALYTQQNIDSDFVSLVFEHTVPYKVIVGWIRDQYVAGDTLYIAGYSAGGGIAINVAKELNKFDGTQSGISMFPVMVNGLALIDEFGIAGNAIYENVRNLYVYYQEGCGAIKIECIPGDANYNIKLPPQTNVVSNLVEDVDHLSIDNSPDTWKHFGDFVIADISNQEKSYFDQLDLSYLTNPVMCNFNGSQVPYEVLSYGVVTNQLPPEALDGCGQIDENLPQTPNPTDPISGDFQVPQTPNPPATQPNPNAGYDNGVGIDKVELCKNGSKGCKKSVEFTLNDISNRDIRAKLKRKGDWKDVEVSYYLSDDTNLDDNDILLGTKHKNLSADEYSSKDKKSVYLKDVNLNSQISKSGTYYLLVEVSYKGGTNQSTEGDKTERVKLTIVDPPVFVPPAFCANLPTLRNQISQLQADVNYHLQKEREHRSSEKHWRAEYKKNSSKAREYRAKYQRNKDKYSSTSKKKKKKKYKKKYKKAKKKAKKYEKKANKAKGEYQKADQRKNNKEDKKKKAQKELNEKRNLLATQQGQCG